MRHTLHARQQREHQRMADAGTAENASPPVSARDEPQDAEAVRAVLSAMGVSDYEPRVVHMLLEFV